MKLNDFAQKILSVLRDNPNADAAYILSRGLGQSEPEIDFVILQLQMFSYA
ncbi:hypothetical protein [Rahnella sp. ChDrAdgB13]|uniref:hypothetical protein n=1 Tax=Rahnella sp. ChDrAdgB13 TaxID=1850581 RepID=UPI001AD89317|nr:hypothetical protein [Rahnella sp. ChDrAdgB13]